MLIITQFNILHDCDLTLFKWTLHNISTCRLNASYMIIYFFLFFRYSTNNEINYDRKFIQFNYFVNKLLEK